MHKHQATVQTPSKASRVRTLAVSLTVLLVGASFYARNVRAEQGPADCARLSTVDSAAGACMAPRS